MITPLQKLNTISLDQIDTAVLLGHAARPNIRPEVAHGFGLTNATEWLAQDRAHQFKEALGSWAGRSAAMAREKGLGVQNRLKIIKIGGGQRSCLGAIEGRKEAGSVEGRTQEVSGFQEPNRLIGRHQGHIAAMAAAHHHNLTIIDSAIRQSLE